MRGRAHNFEFLKLCKLFFFFTDEFPSPLLNLYFIELVNPTNFFEQLSNSAVNEKWNYIKFHIYSALVTLLFALRFNTEYDIILQYKVDRHFWKCAYFFKLYRTIFLFFLVLHTLLYGCCFPPSNLHLVIWKGRYYYANLLLWVAMGE